MQTFYHTLDYNGLYRLKLEYDAKAETLAVAVDDQSAPWDRLKKAIGKQLYLYHTPDPDNLQAAGARILGNFDEKSGKLMFNHVDGSFVLRLNRAPIGSYALNHPTVGPVAASSRLITGFDIRRLGTFHRADIHEERPTDKNLIARAKKAIFTDFHTHSSGQITPQGLLDVAIAHDAYYPISLLHDAGIDTSFQNIGKHTRKLIDRVPFPPRDTPGMTDQVEAAPLSKLSPKERTLLERKMAMLPDRQSTYAQMETDAYRYRYPLTKNEDLTADTVRWMAKDYAKQGVKYAEISYVGYENKQKDKPREQGKPELMRVLHETIAETDRDDKHHAKLRTLIGVPRNFSSAKIEETLAKVKIYSASPYVVGVDFLGYEITETKTFEKQLNEFCAWANENRPGFTVRVHAGETNKHPSNVKDFLKLAERYPNLKFRVGHGIFGMDDEALAIAKKLCKDPKNPRLLVEFNPDSVLALNNIDSVKQIPFEKLIKNGIPFSVSSDSGGTYGTDTTQLGLAAYYAGLDEKSLKLLEKHQKHFMDQQLAYSQERADAIAHWETPEGRKTFIDGLIAEADKVPPAKETRKKEPTEDEMRAVLSEQEVSLVTDANKTPELNNRTPITIVGASGKRWTDISPTAQDDITIAMDMLTQALDPEKAYFVRGRAKPTGLSDVMTQAIQYVNKELVAAGSKPFFTFGMLLGAQFDGNAHYERLTHLQPIDEKKWLDLAEALVKHTTDHNGVMIAAGGGHFTRDFILRADQADMRSNHPDNKKMLLLFTNADGASQEKAAVLHPDYQIEDGKMILTKLFNIRPDLFSETFRERYTDRSDPSKLDVRKLDDFYQDSMDRVQKYSHQPEPDPDAQDLESGETITQQKHRGKK